MGDYKNLEIERIVDTVYVLTKRIRERFPNATLADASNHLHTIALQADQRAEWIARPIRFIRIAAFLVILMIVLALVATIVSLNLPNHRLDLIDFVNLFESTVNDLVLVGIAIFFLLTLENRLKRKRALNAIHELRSFAHIVDMLQLTKDPDRVLPERRTTISSPHHEMNGFEMGRYLDYCIELLSLTGKIAAVYVQKFDDQVALNAVNEIENLTTGLSNKIFQKISILYNHQHSGIDICGMD